MMIVADDILRILPRWAMVDDAAEVFETTASGVVWRLWVVDNPVPGDSLPAGWRLAPRDALERVRLVTGRGLYHVLDRAGMQVVAFGRQLRGDDHG